MRKIVKTVRFTGKNLNDVFGLDCVKLIMKIGYDEPLLVLRSECLVKSADVCKCSARVGEILVQYSDGLWEVQA